MRYETAPKRLDGNHRMGLLLNDQVEATSIKHVHHFRSRVELNIIIIAFQTLLTRI